MKKAVVTGGAGFIGSHIVEALLKKDIQVLIIDNFSTGRESNIEAVNSLRGTRPEILRENICSTQIHSALKSFKPDAVFHLAAQMDVRKSVSDPVFDSHENVLGTVNLLEAARLCGTERFIFTSTGGAIYGEQEYYPADEAHPTRPKCPYGVSKRASELYLEYYARECGLSITSLRLANVYGPRQNPFGEAGVVAIFAHRALRGQVVRINGDGTQTRDFVFVRDVARAAILAAQRSTSTAFEVFNVGTGKETSVCDLVSGFKTVWKNIDAPNKPDDIKVEHGPAAPGEQKRSVISSAKIEAQLGWQPSVCLAEGLEQTIQSFV